MAGRCGIDTIVYNPGSESSSTNWEHSMARLPAERELFASYKLWRKHADPDGLVSASEFEEMDEDDKREALRGSGGPVADSGFEEEEDEAETPDEADADEDLEEDEVLPGADAESDDPLEGEVVELTEDIVDERTEGSLHVKRAAGNAARLR